MRKLASIRVINGLRPIANADRIELASIDGWQCIVKKGEYKVGDLCVYFEIDSLLPTQDRYAFLTHCKRDYGIGIRYRIKTMKMRGVVSQGLALPLSIFPELLSAAPGDDVTELLDIHKHGEYGATAVNTESKTNGRFPSFIPKTEQERIQNLPHYYEEYKDSEWEETLKLDGSSMTVFKVTKPTPWYARIVGLLGFTVSTERLGVCSRNLEIKPKDNYTTTFDNGGVQSEYSQGSFWCSVTKHEIAKYLPVGFALQGELVGPRIQGNHEKVQENHFLVFDVFDIQKGHYLLPEERHVFMDTYIRASGIIPAPVVSSHVKVFTECPTLELLQERVRGESINPDTISEGRVYKHTTIRGLSFKCISNEYLLKDVE